MTERRRFLRFETALNALCEIITDRFKASSKVRNISKEGALITIDKRLDEGTEIALSMDVPGDNIPIVASGKVAWQRGKDGLYDTGIKFTKINNLDKGRLLEYIYTQWLRLIDKKE